MYFVFYCYCSSFYCCEKLNDFRWWYWLLFPINCSDLFSFNNIIYFFSCWFYLLNTSMILTNFPLYSIAFYYFDVGDLVGGFWIFMMLVGDCFCCCCWLEDCCCWVFFSTLDFYLYCFYCVNFCLSFNSLFSSFNP